MLPSHFPTRIRIDQGGSISNMPSHISTATSEHAVLDPRRCQFSFTDGRQCRMQSAQPVLCSSHASTRAQAETNQSRQKFATSLAPLSGEFRTATEINCALGKVFLSLAQNRLPRRDAVALGYLAQLMLQTLPGVKEEYIAGLGYQQWKESLDAALQEDPQDDATEPIANAAAAEESRAGAKGALEVSVPQLGTPPERAGASRPEALAVPLGTPTSALASCSPQNKEAAAAHTEGPEPPALALGAPISRLAPRNQPQTTDTSGPVKDPTESEDDVSVAVLPGTPISALASFDLADSPITTEPRTDQRPPHKSCVARVFSESALADSDEDGADLLSPPETTTIAAEPPPKYCYRDARGNPTYSQNVQLTPLR
jgi:hypothetical protein